MSSKHTSSCNGSSCTHSETVDDDHTGECVCTQCGLVLGPVYQDELPKHDVEDSWCFQNFQNGSRSESVRDILQDLCSHAEIPRCIMEYAENYFKQIKTKISKNKTGKKFRDKDLVCYALQETLGRHEINHIADELPYFAGVKLSIQFQIESALGITTSLCNPLDYCERFCNLLEMSYLEMKIIRGILFHLQVMLSSHRPQSVVALAIYLYCLETKNQSLSLLKICEICRVSSKNIEKLKTNLGEPYISNISILYKNMN